MTAQIITAVKKGYESQGSGGLTCLRSPAGEVERSLSTGKPGLIQAAKGLTVVSMVGVNGTGKDHDGGEAANLVQSRGQTAVLAACDTFRAAAIEQLKLWGQRLKVTVIAGADKADPASIAHDAITAALAAMRIIYLLILPADCTPSII